MNATNTDLATFESCTALVARATALRDAAKSQEEWDLWNSKVEIAAELAAKRL